jgi:hypothetical protein
MAACPRKRLTMRGRGRVPRLGHSDSGSGSRGSSPCPAASTDIGGRRLDEASPRPRRRISTAHPQPVELLASAPAEPPGQRAEPSEEVAVDLGDPLQGDGLTLLLLERLPDGPLFDQLTPGSAHVVGEHDHRLRGGLHLRPTVVAKADGPAAELLDLAVVHPARIFASPRAESHPFETCLPKFVVQGFFGLGVLLIERHTNVPRGGCGSRVAEIIEAAGRFTSDGRPGAEYGIFLCECMRSACRNRLRLRNRAYQAIAAHPARFLIAPGHESRDLEQVVECHDEYAVVQIRSARRHLRAVSDPDDPTS